MGRREGGKDGRSADRKEGRKEGRKVPSRDVSLFLGEAKDRPPVGMGGKGGREEGRKGARQDGRKGGRKREEGM